MYEFYLGGKKFPMTPSKYKVSINGMNKTMNLINGSEINLIKPAGLSDISFDLRLPCVPDMPYAVYEENEFRTAGHYLEWIEYWKAEKKPIELKIVREIDHREKSEDLIKDVTIESYDILEDAEEGYDIIVSLKLKTYEPYGAKEIVLNGDKMEQKAISPKPDKDRSKAYVVKKGDSLWKIAKKELNNALRYKEIYELNKSAIEKEAKKYGRKSSSGGHWIYPGLKLKLPK